MRVKSMLAVSAVVLLAFLSGCEVSPAGGCENEVAPAAVKKGDPPKGPKNPGTPPPTSSGTGCDTYVTATQVMCAFGAWGSTWFKLDDGHYLQPWNNSTTITQLVVGGRYKIAYSLMAKDSRYDNLIMCFMIPSDPMALTPGIVSVSCIEPVAN